MKQKVKSTLQRVIKTAIAYTSPVEREFRLIWPNINSIEGLLVSPAQEHWLFKTARSLPDGSNIVEIGSFKGRSTCCLAYGCKGTKKRVFTIDTFEGNNVDFFHKAFFDEFWDNVKRCGLTNYVTPIKGLSSEVARFWDKPIHLLFIDGSHEYEDVVSDFLSFFPHVVAGGIVAVHDVVNTWPGPLKAWNEVIKHHLENTGSCTTLAYGTKPKARK